MALELVAAERAGAARTHTRSGSRARSRPPRPHPQPATSACARRTCTAPTPCRHAAGTQTIALVDAYNDLTAEEDLEAYDTEFGLPNARKRTAASRRSTRNGETGSLPFPATAEALKKATQGLAERSRRGRRSRRLDRRDLARHRDRARDLPELPHRAGRGELALLRQSRRRRDGGRRARSRRDLQLLGRPGMRRRRVLECVPDSSAFDHPGVVITASAGDDGYLNWLEEPRSAYANFPASSPHVVAVGGTRLSPWGQRRMDRRDGLERRRRKRRRQRRPRRGRRRMQHPVRRAAVAARRLGLVQRRLRQRSRVADVAADADPYSGLAVYDSSTPANTRPKRKRTSGTRRALVHDRRHEPRIAARSLRVRARRRCAGRRIPGADALRKCREIARDAA